MEESKKSLVPSDTEMLDWLDKNAKGYGNGWVCRDSVCGLGLRLHETSDEESYPNVRTAIYQAMRRGV